MKVIPYIHRDLSWLSFNYRVLQEAKDPNVPLLERVKFLAIYSSNLDEFFRVRVANHRNLVRAGKKPQKNLAFEPEKVLVRILKIVNTQQEEFTRILEEEILPELIKIGIQLKTKKFSEDQLAFMTEYFIDHLQPYVHPIILMEDKVKPFLNNANIYLALQLKDKSKPNAKIMYALLRIPSDKKPRFIELPSKKKDKNVVVLLDDIVRNAAQLIFPGFDIVGSYSIKLSRDAELYIDDEFSGDLISKVKKSLSKRNIGVASRLVYDRKIPDDFLQYLMNAFRLHKYDLSPEGRQHNNSDFFKFPSFGLNNLKDPVLNPLSYPPLEKAKSIFDKIAKRDHMLYFPYHSYESVIQFFEQAADDPKVTHIKIIQYRVAKVSRIMNALMKAVKKGKQVTAFIEIKARFDEEANLQWGEKLEEAGVTVFYSMPGLKVHSKMAIVRKVIDKKEQLYSYISTGNFHEDTAKLYTDFGMFTADERITNEVIKLFRYLETKRVPEQKFENLLVGQFNLNEELEGLIDQEIHNAKEGKKAKITLKLNSLQDKDIIKRLYKASNAGVTIKIIVRGICSLVPDLANFSKNIECISIIDRFLEHPRVFIFENNGKEKMFISSADWMVRNLHHRIETIVPVYNKEIRKFIKKILGIQFSDNTKARIIDKSQANHYKSDNSNLSVRSQVEIYHYIKRNLELDAWIN